MWKLLRAEFYQLFRRKSFYLIILGIGIICIYFYTGMGNVIPIDEVNGMMYVPRGFGLLVYIMGKGINEFSGTDAIIQAYVPWAVVEILEEINPVMLVSLFYSTYIVGTSFGKRTIDRPIVEGYSRKSVFAVKTIVYYVSSIVIFLVFLIAFICSQYRTYWLQIMPVGMILRCILVWIYLCMAMISVPLLITFVCRDVWKSIIVNFLFFLIVLGVSLSPLRDTVLAQYPTFVLIDMNLWVEELHLPVTQWRTSLTILPTVLIASSILLSYFLFRKAELK